jgi:hypothetical protein
MRFNVTQPGRPPQTFETQKLESGSNSISFFSESPAPGDNPAIRTLRIDTIDSVTIVKNNGGKRVFPVRNEKVRTSSDSIELFVETLIPHPPGLPKTQQIPTDSIPIDEVERIDIVLKP